MVEKAFGKLKERWRVLNRTMPYKIKNCITITKACVALHNFLGQEGEALLLVKDPNPNEEANEPPADQYRMPMRDYI